MIHKSTIILILLSVITLSSGCAKSITIELSAPKRTMPRPDNGFAIAVGQFQDCTSGFFSDSPQKLKAQNLSYEFSSHMASMLDMRGGAIRSASYVEELSTERAILIGNGYDLLLTGEIRSLSVRGGPHLVAIINPLTLFAFFGCPTIYGHADGEMTVYIRLEDLRSGNVVYENTRQFNRKWPDLWWGFWWADWRVSKRLVSELINIGIGGSSDSLSQAIRMTQVQEKSVTDSTVCQQVSSKELSRQPPPSIRNVHVLVVGVGKYEDSTITSLAYAGADARATYEFFTGPQSPARRGNVHLVSDEPNADGLRANKAGILTGIRKYLVNKVGKDDLAILYFSGHGDAGKVAGKTRNVAYYLVPMDARKDNLQDTAIDLETFQKLWDDIPAAGKLLMIDSCNSGGFVAMKDLSIRGVDRLADTQSDTMVFAASRPGQKALGWPEKNRSLFTNVLLDGLKGAADLPVGYGDGSITLGELKLWLEKHVPTNARNKLNAAQTPVVKVSDRWKNVYLTR